MSRYINFTAKLFACFLLIMLWACSDELTYSDKLGDADPDAITLSLFTQGGVSATRSGISDGSKVNRIYYAIYKVTETGDILDTYFHNDGKKYKEFSYKPSDRENFIVKLIPDPSVSSDQKYKIVCWAHCAYEVTDPQNGEVSYVSDYYDINQFPIVKVRYDKNALGYNVSYANNDEERDAFYALKEFTLAAKGKVTDVELTRPLSQINIGTSGWDYEGMASIKPDPKIVKYSKVSIKGVADKLDILNNEATVESQNGSDRSITAHYHYDIIPAYSNINFDLLDEVTGIYKDDTDEWQADEEKGISYHKGVYLKTNTDEEFLKIKFPFNQRPLNPNGVTDWESFDSDKDGYADYVSWANYDQKCIDSKTHDELLYNIYTETFKYLSMSYVLVPFKGDKTDSSKDINNADGSVVEVKFNCAIKKNTEESDDETEESDKENEETPSKGYEIEDIFPGKNVIELNNVPVSRNHRTNIIAADGTGFFMNSNEINVAIQEETFADYYKRLRPLDDDWDRQEQGDENGDGLNDFDWKDDDIDPDGGKAKIMFPDLKDLKLYFNDQSASGNINNNSIDIYLYSDDSVSIDFALYEGYKKYSLLNSLFPDRENDLSFEYWIGNTRIDENRIEKVLDENNKPIEDRYRIKLEMDEIFKEKKNYSPVITELKERETYYEVDEANQSVRSKFVDDSNHDAGLVTVPKNVPSLKYYPIEFRIKTILKDHTDRFLAKDFIVTIRLHTSYKFTFSSTSTDEGGELWDDLIRKGTKQGNYTGANDKENGKYEIGCYFIGNYEYAISKLGRIQAFSRHKDATGNNRLFAQTDAQMGDHLKFKGAAYYSADQYGHAVRLNHLNENCKITVKFGRDFGMDNGSGDNSGDQYERHLYLDWTPEFRPTYKLVDKWYGYNLADDVNKDKVYHNTGSPSPRLAYNETKILSGETEFNGTGVDVELYSLKSGYSVYWVILSELEN